MKDRDGQEIVWHVGPRKPDETDWALAFGVVGEVPRYFLTATRAELLCLGQNLVVLTEDPS